MSSDEDEDNSSTGLRRRSRRLFRTGPLSSLSEPCDANIWEEGPASGSLELAEMMRFDFLFGGAFRFEAESSSSLDILIGVAFLASGAKLIAARLSEEDSGESLEGGLDIVLRPVDPLWPRPGVKRCDGGISSRVVCLKPSEAILLLLRGILGLPETDSG